jgi:hypothetical protein
VKDQVKQHRDWLEAGGVATVPDEGTFQLTTDDLLLFADDTDWVIQTRSSRCSEAERMVSRWVCPLFPSDQWPYEKEHQLCF